MGEPDVEAPKAQSMPDKRRDGDRHPYLIKFEGENFVSGSANFSKVRYGARIGGSLESAMFLHTISRQKFTIPESGAPAVVDPQYESTFEKSEERIEPPSLRHVCCNKCLSQNITECGVYTVLAHTTDKPLLRPGTG